MPIEAAKPAAEKLSADSDTTLQAAAAVTTGVAGAGQTGIAGISVYEYQKYIESKREKSEPKSEPKNMAEVIQREIAKQETEDQGGSPSVQVPAKYSNEPRHDTITTQEGGTAPAKSLENIIQVETTVKTTTGENINIVVPLSKFNQNVKDAIITPEYVENYNNAQIQAASQKDPVPLDQTYNPYSHGTTREIPVSERPGVQESVFKIYDETGKKVTIPKTAEQIYQEEQYNKAIGGMGLTNVMTFVDTYGKDPVGRWDPVFANTPADTLQPGLTITTPGERINQFAKYEGTEAALDRAISSAFAPVDIALMGVSALGVGKAASFGLNVVKPWIIKTVTSKEGISTLTKLGTTYAGMSSVMPSGTEQAYNLPGIKQLTDTGETVRNVGRMYGASNTPTGYIINFGAGVVGDVILKAPMGVVATGFGIANIATTPPLKIFPTLRSNAATSMDAIKTDLFTDPVGAAGSITGGFLIGTKALKIVGQTAGKLETGLVKGAQSSLHAELATQAGLPGSSAKASYYAAGDMVNQIKKLNIDPVEAGTLKIEAATMMEGINPTLVERAMANANSQMYGTSSHAIYNMGNYRLTSDIDFAVPTEKFDTLASDLLKAIPESREPVLSPGQGVRGISALTPSGTTTAHIFDIHKIDPNTPAGKLYSKPDNNPTTINLLETDQTTYPRTPTKLKEYIKVNIPNADGTVLVEPAYSAIGRKYAAVFQPRLGEVSLTLSPLMYKTPKQVFYTTKIDLASYKRDGIVHDLPEGDYHYRVLAPKSISYKTARAVGTIGNIQAKIRILKESGSLQDKLSNMGSGVSELTKRINLIPENADAHRGKDALDVIGIGYEATTHLIAENTINPVKKIIVTRKITKDLDKLTSDPYFSAIARRGAIDKLGDLSPDFAKYLYEKGILYDYTYEFYHVKRVKKQESANEAKKTAYINEKIDIPTKALDSIDSHADTKPFAIPPVADKIPYAPSSSLQKDYGRYSIKRKEPQSSSEYNSAYNKPQSYKPGTYKPSVYSQAAPSKSSSTYPGSSSPRNYQTTSTTPYSIPASYKPGTYKPSNPPIIASPPIIYKIPPVTQPKKKKDEQPDYLKTRYKPLRREVIHHLSIIDPAEAINAGSFTGSRKRPERIINTKDILYEFSGTLRTKKPRKTK